MLSDQAPSVGARIITLRCDAGLLVNRHARSHSAAEYLAAVGSTAGPDSAMAARELSAALFEVFEWVHHRAPTGAVVVGLRALDGGVRIVVELPCAPAAVPACLASIAPSDDGRDPLVDPEPGDGLRELAAVHGVKLGAAAVEGGVRLVLHVPLGESGEQRADGERGEATGER